MKVIFIGSYPPRKCGIATFTYDLRKAVSNAADSGDFKVIAMNNVNGGYDYSLEVIYEIQQNDLWDYKCASDFINSSDADIVCLQHEFGLFGGDAGRYLTTLLNNVKKPIVTSLHTVIKEPSKAYKKSTEELISYSDKLIVMSKMGKGILKEVYKVPDEKIELIYHGVPNIPFIDPGYYKKQLDIKGRFMILTFGLLHPGKGIEVMIDCLPTVVKKYPNLAYIILGATHPQVKKIHGEKYRHTLEQRVLDLGLEDNVIFHDRFVGLKELCRYICASDIYVSPYLSKEQIVSGALSYAIGMGKAIISTPYWYAKEMLSDDRGLLVDFGDFKGLSQALLFLMDNPKKCNHMRRRAYKFGRQMTWDEVGRSYNELFEQVIRGHNTYGTDEQWKELVAP